MNDLKICRKCCATKPLDAFHRASQSKDGRTSLCKECQSAYDQYRRINRDAIKEARRAKREEYECLLSEGKKKCNTCGTTLPFAHYYPSPQSRDGLNSICKECFSEKHKKRYEGDPEKYRELSRVYGRAHVREIVAKAAIREAKDPEKYKRLKRESRKRQMQNQEKRQENIDRARRWYKENKERHIAGGNVWKERNREKVRLYHRRRKAWRKGAQGMFGPEDIYRILDRQNGLCAYHGMNPKCSVFIFDTYTIDHALPLSRGGSNQPENLQLLCEHCNKSKGAKTHEEYLAWLRCH